MASKIKYRIRNWSEYNKALINRGRITFWFSDDYTNNWLNSDTPRRIARPKTYSDIAIECMLLIRSVFHLPLRGLQGFVDDLIDMAGLTLLCPNYTTVCRRAKELNIRLP